MPSPNPQPRPQPSSQPATPSLNAKQARVSAATIKPRQQTPPPQDAKPEKRPGSFRLLVGLLATFVGSWLLTLEDYQPSNLVRKVGPGVVSVFESEGNIAAYSAPTESAKETVLDFLTKWQSTLYLAEIGVGLLLLMFAGFCLKRRLFLFFITTVILVTASLGAMESMAYTPQLAWIVIGAFVLAYLIQSGTERIMLPPVGMLGYLLIFLSLMATTRHWFDWPAMVDWTSAQWAGFPRADVAGFLNRWGELVTWCIVLTLATLGASFSKGRLLHVLGATLLAVLVMMLLKDARYELVHFPQLGPDVKPIASNAIANVQGWQWLVLIELTIVCAVLVYRGLGAGGFTVTIAVLWLLAGFQVDSLVGRFMLGSVSGNIDLTTSGTGASASAPNAINGDIIAAIAAAIWIYLNAAFAGIIAVCGFRMMFKEAAARWWIGNVLWIVFAMLAMWVYLHWPQYEKFSLLSQIQVLVYYEVHQVVILMVAALTAAVFGVWALRWNSRYDTWLYMAASMVFLGTLASFGALAVMIKYSFLEPLPITSYIALAIGQSSLMWVLLLHVNFRDHRVDRSSGASSRPPRGAMPSLA